jgi:hypothetical protein
LLRSARDRPQGGALPVIIVTFLITISLDPFRFLLIAVSGWINQQQLELIDLSVVKIRTTVKSGL